MSTWEVREPTLHVGKPEGATLWGESARNPILQPWRPMSVTLGWEDARGPMSSFLGNIRSTLSIREVEEATLSPWRLGRPTWSLGEISVSLNLDNGYLTLGFNVQNLGFILADFYGRSVHAYFSTSLLKNDPSIENKMVSFWRRRLVVDGRIVCSHSTSYCTF